MAASSIQPQVHPKSYPFFKQKWKEGAQKIDLQRCSIGNQEIEEIGGFWCKLLETFAYPLMILIFHSSLGG